MLPTPMLLLYRFKHVLTKWRLKNNLGIILNAFILSINNPEVWVAKIQNQNTKHIFHKLCSICVKHGNAMPTNKHKTEYKDFWACSIVGISRLAEMNHTRIFNMHERRASDRVLSPTLPLPDLDIYMSILTTDHSRVV
jgi:hypothetical protein